MKGKKCSGLLLALFIMVGLSLSVCSNDSSALKYKLSTVDFGTPHFYTGSGSLPPSLRLDYDISDFSSDPYSPPSDLFVFFPYYYSTDRTCLWRSGSSIYTPIFAHNTPSSGNYSIEAGFSYYLPYNYESFEGQCQLINTPYGDYPDSNSNYRFQWSTLPAYSFGTPNLSLNKPFFYTVSGAYINADVKQVEGLITTAKLDFADIFGHAPYNFSRLIIPFGVDYDRHLGDISSNTNLRLEGSFMFDSDNPSTDIFTLPNDFYGQFRIVGPSAQQVIPCSFSLTDNRSSDEYPWELSYVCEGFTSASYPSGNFSFVLELYNSWSYPATVMLYEGSYLITDGDNTDSGLEIGTPISGDIEKAPGFPTTQITGDSNVNWFTSLTRMFSFDFINPFTPIFAMFTNNDDCAQIPTLAGMMHGPSEVCPWFPVSVRQILTPVFGLSSFMLLFGFIVRWLGSSSGNFFEDSSGETLTYSKWYSDGRGFHRTAGSPNRRINK